MARDWQEWHRGYDDPHSALSNRLTNVVAMIRQCLDTAAAGSIRVLSLCSGDARDMAAALADHPRRADVVGCAVEMDPHLAAVATVNLESAGAAIEVRCADAGDSRSFADALPVDLLMLVGIFGNISDEDVHRMVTAVPRMAKPGATVIWTRHRRAPDLTPSIRRWFDEAGCECVDLVSPGTGGFAIGCERVGAATVRAFAEASVSGDLAADARLFTFRDDAW